MSFPSHSIDEIASQLAEAAVMKRELAALREYVINQAMILSFSHPYPGFTEARRRVIEKLIDEFVLPKGYEAPQRCAMCGGPAGLMFCHACAVALNKRGVPQS